MARYLDDLKRLIYDQTQKLGVSVSNIYGTAQPLLTELGGAERSSWRLMRLASRTVSTVEAFYTQLATNSAAPAQLIESDTGAVVSTHTGSESITTLFRGSAELSHARSFVIAAQAGDQQANFWIVVDGQIKKQGTNGGEVSVYLEPGAHVIEVLVASNYAAVQVPKDLRIRGDFERIPAPVWKSVATGYMDATQGQAVVTLTWYSDARAGGWRILRRQPVNVAPVTAVGTADAQARFTATVSGDHSTTLAAGLELYSGNELMGTILSANYDGTNTLVRLQLPVGRSAPSPYWVNRTARKGTFTVLQQVGRVQTTGDVSWRDTSVTTNEVYEYALQAFGTVDSGTWSPLSALQLIRAGDTTAPGVVTHAAGYPQVVNRQAYAKFTTPGDSDYAGVRVYYREKYTGTTVAATSNTLTATGSFSPALDSTWKVRITSGPGVGQERSVVSSTGAVATISAVWLTTPTTASVYMFYKDTQIVTDYGIPNTTDQLTFQPVSTDPASPAQEYHFRTFDHALNEQTDVEADAATWTYNPGTDGTWTVPPIVGIRQVPTSEQTAFSAPYNNTTNYALVELSGSDIASRKDDITIFYQRRADGSPVSLPATAAPTTEGGTPRQLDNPVGTRSRYIAIERTPDMNWVKVYAVDGDNNRSDTITYSVDFDDQAEVASLEGRLDTFVNFVSAAWNDPLSGNEYGSGTDNVTGVIRVTGTVDDDARSIKYWIEGGTGTDPLVGSPRIVDLSTTRSFAFAFTLADGQRKNLVIEAWSNATAVAPGVKGTQVQREFARTPRSVAHFEDKDENGDASGSRVKVLFDLAPAAADVFSGPVYRTAHASSSTATTLVDSGSPGWTAGQFAKQGRQKYFVWMHDGTAATSAINTGAPTSFEVLGQIREIVSNTTTALTVTPAWTTIPHGARYRIVNAAVMLRLGASGTFRPSAGISFFDRTAGAPTTLDYYASRNGCPDEPQKRVMVDADTIPSFDTLTLTEPTPNTLRLAVSNPDDDVKTYRVYRRKGAVPTAAGGTTWPNGLTAASLLTEYLHHGPVPVSTLTYDSYAGTGTHYVAVVPTNALNQDGTPLTSSRQILGSSSAPRADLSPVTPLDVSGTYNNKINWTHANVSNGDTSDHTVRIYAQRRVLATNEIDISEFQLVTDRYASLDAANTSPFNTGNTDTTANQGSFVHAGLATRLTSGTAYRWEYRLELWTTGGSPAKVFEDVELHEDYYAPPGISVTAASVVSDQGSGSGNVCISSPYNDISWSVDENATGYGVTIEVSTASDPSTGSWTTLVTGLSPGAGNYRHDFQSFYGQVGGSVRNWTYRVFAYNISSGLPSGSTYYTNNSTTAPTSPSVSYQTTPCLVT